MATAASNDPDPDPEQQQARDVTAHQDSERKEVAEALSMLPAVRERISQLLGAAEPLRRRCSSIMETELSIIAAFLSTLKARHLDTETKRWLSTCILLFGGTLNEVEPRHPRRAEQRFSREKSQGYPLPLVAQAIQNLYGLSQYPRYLHLFVTSSDTGFTPQLAETVVPLVGIDRPAKKILRWLTYQGKMDMNLRVMSIVGPVGIGKTTLAVELRNRLTQHETSGFQCNVMVQALRGTDRNIRLLHDILSQVSEPAATGWSSDPSQAKAMEVLVRLVSEHLQDKRYFIIIDDMLEASDWEEIKGAFPGTNNLGSRILITTCSTSTAWACCSYFYDGLVHEMKPLGKIDSQRLLLAKAVHSVDGIQPNDMKPCCDEILWACGGIPLFIIGMIDWAKEQAWQLPERLEQALSSAFMDLPSDGLRLILLYMAMFPYGYKFEKDRLILKWIHEGLTHHYSPNVFYLNVAHRYSPHHYSSEAERFFSQLVDRNVITCVTPNCMHKQHEAKACQWTVNNAFMHLFLAYKSAEMGFAFTGNTLNLVAASAAETTDRGIEISSRMPRRLSLHLPNPQLPSLLETMDLSETHSLTVSGAVSRLPLDKFVNLVVLDLEGWENLKYEDLLLICKSKMIFLGYLSIRNTRVNKLPREIRELRILRALDVSYTQITELPLEIKELSLQTLDISHTQITELPLEVFKLTFLQHLDLRGTRISQLPNQIVGLRYSLVNLLFGGKGTINLPCEVMSLHMLQTLATVDLTEQPANFLKALSALHSLRVLAVIWSFHKSNDKHCCKALVSCIQKWWNLESLTIHCGLGCSMEFLGYIERSRAPKKLEKFMVTAGRFASVPQWLKGLELLSFVQITVCKQGVGDLKILGELATLQCLILGLDFIARQPIVIENGWFKRLHRFSVDCPTMPWVIFETGAMQQLTHLQLKFSSGPTSEDRALSGISNLLRIGEVVLSYSKHCVNSTTVKMTVKAVKEQVAKHHNPIDLFIKVIEDDDVQIVDEEAENATGTSLSRTDDGPRHDAQAVDDEATGELQTEITEA